MAIVDQPADAHFPLPHGEEVHPKGMLRVIVVTPERTVLSEFAHFVAITLYDGEIGICPGRAPLLGRVGYGELRIGQDKSAQRFYVDGGFVEVANNVVSVLTNRAVPADELNSADATRQLAAARARPSNSPELLEIRDRLELQARAQIRVAGRA